MTIHCDSQRLVSAPRANSLLKGCQLQSKKRGTVRSPLRAKFGQTVFMMLFSMTIFYFSNALGALPTVAAEDTTAAKVDDASKPKDIWEHVLYDDLKQGPNSYSYYKMTVGPRYYTGSEHLTIKVITDNYLSDPDVYISKTVKKPTSSLDSQWYCEREGSETCILHNGEFEVGDTLYIGVRCEEACKYKLRAWFVEVSDLSESSRTQMRFGAHTTHILKYYIPPDTENVRIEPESIEIKVEPEDEYAMVDLFLSLDANFYIIEEKPATHVV